LAEGKCVSLNVKVEEFDLQDAVADRAGRAEQLVEAQAGDDATAIDIVPGNVHPVSR
jgi:hypothetical protein